MSYLQATSKPFVCARCLLRQQRFRSYSSSTRSPPPPSPPTGAAKLTNRRLISLIGQDAPKFLQGIITHSVQPGRRQSGFYAAFLTAQGKVLHDVFIYPTLGTQWHERQAGADGSEDHGYLVEVDAYEAESLMKHIKRHKLRSNFTLRLLGEGELNVWSVWKQDERWTAHSQASAVDDNALGLTDCRTPAMGRRLLLPSPSSGSGLEQAGTAVEDVEEVPASAYMVRRYLRGVPEGQNEIPKDESLPMNSNIDIMGGIDFKKGCYIGQELTIRTHHTGVVRRRILPLALYEHGQQPPEHLEYDSAASLGPVEGGQNIRRDDQRKRSTGKLIASLGNVGLGMCRLEQMSDLTVSGEGSSFSTDDRFIIQSADSAEVGVKAFVPDWMRGRIREPKIQKRVE